MQVQHNIMNYDNVIEPVFQRRLSLLREIKNHVIVIYYVKS